MGKQAREKLKRRQRDQKLMRRANAHQRQLMSAGSEAVELVTGFLDSATAAPADVKAVQADLAEVVESFARNPDAMRRAVEVTTRFTRKSEGLLPGAQMQSQLPGISARIVAAVQLLTTEVNRTCSHINDPNQNGSFHCVWHPDRGISCINCHDDHVKTHAKADEFRCDECGKVDTRSITQMSPTPITGVPVRAAGGRVSRHLAPVFVLGLGVCRPCLKPR